MAKHGVLMERDNLIASLTQNRAGIASVEIDGGAPVVEGAIESENDELYALTAFATGTARVGVAYNPSAPRDEDGRPVWNPDDRYFTNRAGDVVDYFFPEIGIEFGIQGANVTGTPVVGDTIQPTDGTLLYGITTGAVVDGEPEFEVVQIKSASYPTGGFDSDAEPVYIVKTVFNGQ